MSSITANLKSVKQQIAQAAKKADRNPADIKLVVAGKYADTATTLQAIKAGVKIIGENREQDLKEKFTLIGNKAEWHFIGHLQTNKVKSIVAMVSLIHSVDSLHLAQEIDKQAGKLGKIMPVLIEVNTSGEATKSGVPLAAAAKLVKECQKLPHTKVTGLMTMGSLVDNPEDNRRHFASLKKLAYKLNLPELSMGTTQDFAVAIEEGATIVRVGSAIFH